MTSRAARVVAAGSAAALVVVGGWAAVLALGVVAAAVVRRDGDRLVVTRPTVLPVIVLTAVGGVVVLGLLGDRGRDAATGPFGLTAQLLLLVALAAVVCAAWPDRSRTR